MDIKESYTNLYNEVIHSKDKENIGLQRCYLLSLYELGNSLSELLKKYNITEEYEREGYARFNN